MGKDNTSKIGDMALVCIKHLQSKKALTKNIVSEYLIKTNIYSLIPSVLFVLF